MVEVDSKLTVLVVPYHVLCIESSLRANIEEKMRSSAILIKDSQL